MSEEFPPAVSVMIGDAIVAELMEAALPENPIIERSYAEWDMQLNGSWQIEPSDRPNLEVAMHTTEVETQHGAQGMIKFVVPADICVRKRFDPTTQVSSTGRIDVREIDALMRTHQAVLLTLFEKRLRSLEDAVWMETKPIVAPWKDHLRELRQFTSIVRTTFTLSLQQV